VTNVLFFYFVCLSVFKEKRSRTNELDRRSNSRLDSNQHQTERTGTRTKCRTGKRTNLMRMMIKTTKNYAGTLFFRQNKSIFVHKKLKVFGLTLSSSSRLTVIRLLEEKKLMMMRGRRKKKLFFIKCNVKTSDRRRCSCLISLFVFCPLAS
jgi:hypothetical protein